MRNKVKIASLLLLGIGTSILVLRNKRKMNNGILEVKENISDILNREKENKKMFVDILEDITRKNEEVISKVSDSKYESDLYLGSLGTDIEIMNVEIERIKDEIISCYEHMAYLSDEDLKNKDKIVKEVQSKLYADVEV